MAWACRNLLEIAIFSRFVLISPEKAKQFTDDRLIDGPEIAKGLRKLEEDARKLGSRLAVQAHLGQLPLDEMTGETLNKKQSALVASGKTHGLHLQSTVLGDRIYVRLRPAARRRSALPRTWNWPPRLQRYVAHEHPEAQVQSLLLPVDGESGAVGEFAGRRGRRQEQPGEVRKRPHRREEVRPARDDQGPGREGLREAGDG